MIMVPQLKICFQNYNQIIISLQDCKNPQTAIASQKSEVSCNTGKFTFR